MSGVEIVGLVLGAIPLVISGLEHYGEGVRTIRAAMNFRQEIRTLKRRVAVEQVVFRNAIALLLKDAVEDVSSLLDDPKNELWSSPATEAALRRKLQDSFDVFKDTIVSMDVTIKELVNSLDLNKDGKFIAQRQLPGQHRMIADQQQGPSYGSRAFRESIERIKFSLKRSAYADLIGEIQQDNRSLNKLTEQAPKLEAMRVSRRKFPDSEKLRQHAMAVFGMLQIGFHGSCTASHRVSLCLRAPQESPAGSASVVSSPGQSGVRLVLHHELSDLSSQQYRWTVEEAELRPYAETLASDPVPSNRPHELPKRGVRFQAESGSHKMTSAISDSHEAVEIRDLCATLPQLRSHQCGVCLGYLGDPSSDRYGLYWPMSPLVTQSTFMTLSLDKLLTSQTTHRNRLTGRNSRRLAQSLANSVLRLYDTPWLSKQWGRNEVTLFQKDDKVLFEHPFLSTLIRAAPIQGAPHYFSVTAQIRNETLFALGIILIELCLEKRFDELLTAADLNPDGSKHAASDFLAASRLLDDIYDTAGKRYGDAVKRCILCEFEIDRRNTSFADGQFRRAFYEGVVAVLDEDVRQFCGESL